MHRRLVASALALFLFGTSAVHAQDSAGVEFFEAKIRPLLVEHCQKCHGETKQRGGLRLDSKAGWEKGGDSGPAIVPKNLNRSHLIRMVRGTPKSVPEMPPDYRLSPELVEHLVKWVEMGAPDPRVGTVQAKSAGVDWKKAREFWAFQPLVAAKPPQVKGFDQPIDRFVAAQLQAKKLTPMGRADRWTLLRRATFGLTGLPPTREEMTAFLQDNSSDAWAKVIDRLLASPRYGEHQARAWLDLARYAEDQAHASGTGNNPHAWRYRDWVIAAFNQDLPYDRFVKLQIAADLFEQPGDDPNHRSALGFIGLGPVYYKNSDILRGVAEELDDRIDTLTRGFLGLTVACARCHDHKFDPIPTQDYYSLAGVFSSSKLSAVPVATPEKVEAYESAKAKATDAEQRVKDLLQVEKDRLAASKVGEVSKYMLAAWTLRAKKLDRPETTVDEEAKSAGLDKDTLSRMAAYLKKQEFSNFLLEYSKAKPLANGPREPSAEVRQAIDRYVEKVRANLEKPLVKGRNLDLQKDLFEDKGVFPITEKDVLAVAPVAWKKEYEQLRSVAQEAASKVPPELPACHGVVEAKPTTMKVYLRGNPYKLGELAPRRFLRILAGPEPPPFTQGSGRKELAEAIADPSNPLTARVFVNRIWQQHFGRGIVATPSNFGILGERPTHPELLDYLTAQFLRHGWSIKKLHREILLSETYQRSSQIDPRNHEVDPDNHWLWRANRRRLPVEAVRDALLAVSQELDLAMDGPSVDLDDLKNHRRAIYGKISRLDLSKLLRLFDFPDPNITSDRRNETTIPQQLLFAMNSPFFVARAKALADRLEQERDEAARVRRAYELAFARTPNTAEATIGSRYLALEDSAEDRARNQLTRLQRYAQSLLASNEFFYLD